ncbi:hypothetical protein F4810DRAFT_710009 [Camillea tinctor]|nr:hypothetical protein F4810DRAFT_710009 [Camillea tinctor]
MKTKPDFRHMMLALLARLQREGRGNEFYRVLRSKLLHVLEVNLDTIAMCRMAASEVRWEVYREIVNHFCLPTQENSPPLSGEKSIPDRASLFPHVDQNTPFPEGCLVFDIFSMDKAITAQTADSELIDILWGNGYQQKGGKMPNGDDASQSIARNALLSLAESIGTPDHEEEVGDTPMPATEAPDLDVADQPMKIKQSEEERLTRRLRRAARKARKRSKLEAEGIQKDG